MENDFYLDLARIDKIRETIADMRRYNLRGMIPQDEALFLLSFIDKLWVEYTRTLRRADSAGESHGG